MSGIVVGVDGSAHSQRALEWAASEAANRGVPLTILTVLQTGMAPCGPSAGLNEGTSQAESQREMARDMADKALATLGETQRPKVVIDALAGVPADELIRASQDADMEVVGSRGAGGFARLRLGSVSTQLVHHAHCPVVVIPA